MLAVVTGGARSGKSSVAQDLAVQLEERGAQVTVAVFGTPADEEMAERIARHRSERPSVFVTREVQDPRTWDPHAVQDALLVDCLGTMLDRIMALEYAAHYGELPDPSSDHGITLDHARSVETAMMSVAGMLVSRTGPTIVVTNEVGDGVVPAFASGRLFRDVIGRANRRLVASADISYLCVAGRLVPLDGLPTRAVWPHD